MSFDIEPDAPVHGECEAEIKRLGLELAASKEPEKELDALRNYFLKTEGAIPKLPVGHVISKIQILEANIQAKDAE